MGTGQALSLVLTEEFLPCSYDAPNLDRDVSPVLFKRYSLELPFSAMASLTCPAATEDGTPKRDGGSERVRAAEECALSAYFPFVP